MKPHQAQIGSLGDNSIKLVSQLSNFPLGTVDNTFTNVSKLALSVSVKTTKTTYAAFYICKNAKEH